MYLNLAVMSHRGTWWIMYMSENINESVFDSSKWFLTSSIVLINLFINFFIAFFCKKRCKKGIKRNLNKLKHVSFL